MPSKLVPMKDRRPPSGGEPLSSLALGAPSLSIAIVLLASLFGSPVLGLTDRVTIVTSYRSTGSEVVERDGMKIIEPTDFVPDTYGPGWWYGPTIRFYFLGTLGVLIPVPALMRKGRRRAAIAAAAVIANAALIAIAHILWLCSAAI